MQSNSFSPDDAELDPLAAETAASEPAFRCGHWPADMKPRPKVAHIRVVVHIFNTASFCPKYVPVFPHAYACVLPFRLLSVV